MRRHVGSNDGLAAALYLSPGLTDAEFRLLALLSQRPDGEQFSADIKFLMDRGMSGPDADDAATSLAAQEILDDPQKGMPGSLFKYHDDERITWRFL